MARGLFGGRKGSRQLDEMTGWPQLSGAVENGALPDLDLPAVAYVLSTTAAATSDAAAAAAAPDRELLRQIAAFRSAVADQLFESSQDYQILCNLTQENLAACDETIEELRRRLAGNIHYTVLAKLDEVHAQVAAHVAGGARGAEPPR